MSQLDYAVLFHCNMKPNIYPEHQKYQGVTLVICFLFIVLSFRKSFAEPMIC